MTVEDVEVVEVEPAKAVEPVKVIEREPEPVCNICKAFVKAPLISILRPPRTGQMSPLSFIQIIEQLISLTPNRCTDMWVGKIRCPITQGLIPKEHELYKASDDQFDPSEAHFFDNFPLSIEYIDLVINSMKELSKIYGREMVSYNYEPYGIRLIETYLKEVDRRTKIIEFWNLFDKSSDFISRCNKEALYVNIYKLSIKDKLAFLGMDDEIRVEDNKVDDLLKEALSDKQKHINFITKVNENKLHTFKLITRSENKKTNFIGASWEDLSRYPPSSVFIDLIDDVVTVRILPYRGMRGYGVKTIPEMFDSPI